VKMNRIYPMHEIHWDKKWKRPKKNRKVLLTVNRCVEKVGYDWDMGTAQAELLQEAGSHPKAPWEGILKHEDFGDFQEKVNNLLGSLSKTIGHAAALRTIERFKRGAVREFVSKRLRSKMCAGAERYLHFAPVEKFEWEEEDAWTGPWFVQGTRRAVTGTYVPGSQGYEPYDYDPPELVNRKTHVLLLATRQGLGDRVVLLASDTCDWSQKVVAETLMKE